MRALALMFSIVIAGAGFIPPALACDGMKAKAHADCCPGGKGDQAAIDRSCCDIQAGSMDGTKAEHSASHTSCADAGSVSAKSAPKEPHSSRPCSDKTEAPPGPDARVYLKKHAFLI